MSPSADQGATPAKPENGPKAIHLKDYKPPAWLVDNVFLDFNLGKVTKVRSRLSLSPNPAANSANGPLFLDGENIELVGVTVNGTALPPAQYEVSKAGLSILKPGSKAFTLEIETTCKPEENKALSGLYRTGGAYCTQCEAQGFRRITYFPDRPDVLTTYDVRIEADRSDAPILLSNGNLVEKGQLDDGKRHFAKWHDPHPKPSYLFALVGGDLAMVEDQFTTMSGREVTLQIFVEHGKEDRCDWAMDSLKRSMRWDEERFGREYDLDIFMIVAVSDFNMGAMENKGLNVFNDKLILARPDTATDMDYGRIEAVIAHEYFHNWTGNRITCRDWFQLCLKEGLTVFRDQEFTSDERSRPVKRITDVSLLKSHQFPEDAGPLAHPVRPASYIEINNFYTATIYEKGAELCRMILTILGKDGFREGLDLYFERHDGEAATVEQFVACFEDAAKTDLSHFMTWYSQAGTPQLSGKLSYDAAVQEATLLLKQRTPKTPGQARKKPQHIPVKLGLIGENGNPFELVLKNGGEVFDGLVHLKDKQESYTFTGITSQPTPSLLRDFSAPVNLKTDLKDKDFEFLMTHDDNAFNRWQSGQDFALSLLKRMVKVIEKGKTPRIGGKYAEAVGVMLSDDTLEPAFKAKLLGLPGEAAMSRALVKDLNPAAMHEARNTLRRVIGKKLRAQLIEIYKNNLPEGPYDPGAEHSGMRSLRNSALGLLAATDLPTDIKRVITHVNKAKNMTDTMAGMGLLTDFDVPERKDIFSAFFEQWQDDHLVLDKWFGLQAMSDLPGAVDRVKDLMTNPKFSLKNPNRVGALIGVFASANPVHFHAADGSGYRLLSDVITKTDGFNPQLAARLISVFRTWGTLEPVRKAHAKDELSRIKNHKNLSKDTFEMVTRILGVP